VFDQVNEQIEGARLKRPGLIALQDAKVAGFDQDIIK
jgi:hypothetical protein